MSQGIIDSDVNNTICEAVGCIAKATTEIRVKVGQRGIISLRCCKYCVGKFVGDEETK
jgi:hypothetical protein